MGQFFFYKKTSMGDSVFFSRCMKIIAPIPTTCKTSFCLEKKKKKEKLFVKKLFFGTRKIVNEKRK